MSPSERASSRSSARDDKNQAKRLVRGEKRPVSGADGSEPTTDHHWGRPGRLNNSVLSSEHGLHPNGVRSDERRSGIDSDHGDDGTDSAALVHLDHPTISIDNGPDESHSNGGRVSRRQLVSLKRSLSDRDLAVLRSLEVLHLMTTRQLERLHCPASEFTPLSGARVMRRTLQQLHDQGLVDRLERRIGGVRAGSASYVQRLSPVGARLLDHPTRRRSREPSLLHLTHVLAVSELVVRLNELVDASTELDLLQVEAEPACWRAIIAAHGGRQLLKPDLRVTIGVGQRELHWFVEQDNATEHRPVITRKCQAYLQAWRDGSETAAAGVFPRVIWVVPDQARAEVIRSVLSSLPEAPEGMFVVTTSARAANVLIGDDP